MSIQSPSSKHFFYELTPDRILNAVEACGFRCTGRCLALNSMENRVYEVEIEVDNPEKLKSRHDAFRVVKFYRPGRWSKEQILEEHQFLEDATEAELPVVAPLKFSDGTTLQSMKDIAIWFAVFPKVGGRINDEFNKTELQMLGRLLGRLHNVGAAKKAPHRMQLTPTTYGRASLALLEEKGILPKNLGSRYRDLVNFICDWSDPHFKNLATQRIHGDCHIGNCLWNASGCFLVDFDDMLNGPCVQDFWLLVPGRDELAKENREIMIEAYQTMRPFNRETLRLIEPLRALRMIHFCAWIAKRWEDPSFQRVFVEFGSEKYWNEQVIALSEISDILRGAEVW